MSSINKTTILDYHLVCPIVQHVLAEERQRTQLLENKTAYLEPIGCNVRSLGYKYQSKHNIDDDRDRGQVAAMIFT